MTRPGISPRPGVSCSSEWSSSICIPTHTPISGLVAAASSTASFRPESCSSRMQSRIAPWPGSTTRSAVRTSSGREVTTTSSPEPCATCITACDTERRLPMP